MKQYLLMGTAVIALAAIATPAEAYDNCEVRRNRSVIRRVQASRPVVYRTYGSPYSSSYRRSRSARYARPVVVRSYGSSYGSSGDCYSRPVVRTYDTVGYGGYRRASGSRLHDRLERAHERAHVRGFRSRGEHRRWHGRAERAYDRADRLRVRRVGWGTRARDCR